MSTSQSLTQLKNIGAKIAGRLNEVGIHHVDDLRRVGPAEAHKQIKNKYPKETLPVCYYLYSFEGALTNTHWHDIGEVRKRQLRNEAGL